MVTVMLSTSNKREEQILVAALSQREIEVILFTSNYQHYVKILQYLPDIIIIEFPPVYSNQIHFVNLIRKHKKLKNIPVLGYGDPFDAAVRKGIMQHGINEYFMRPLKFSALMVSMERRLKQKNKSLEAQPQQSDKYTDTQLLLSTQTPPMQKIEIMTKYVGKLLAFPFTVAKVLKITGDEKAGAAELAKVVEADPAISANILKVSNTVFFASSNRRINSVKDAIVRIGFRETKRIVLSMSVMNLFNNTENQCGGFDRIDFWYHSLACGILAEKFAKRMGEINIDEAFLAGLLHDFGIIIMENFFTDIFKDVLAKTTSECERFINKEISLLGIHHNDLIRELFNKWKLPTELTEAIYEQYQFSLLENKINSLTSKLALCVGLADIVAKAAYLGRECDQVVEPVPNWIFPELKLPSGFSSSMMDSISHDITMYQQFLRLEEREFPLLNKGLENAEDHHICFVNLSNSIFIPSVMYLRKEGMNVDEIKETIDIRSIDGKYDIIVLWTTDKINPEIINNYTQIVRRESSEGKGNFASVLVFTKEGMGAEVTQKLSNVSFMPLSFDLRQLDQNIADISIGKTVEFEPGPVFWNAAHHDETVDAKKS